MSIGYGSSKKKSDNKIGRYVANIAGQKEFTVFVALLVLCLFLAVKSEIFLLLDNQMNILRQFSTIGILAVGEALVLIVGGMDLSVGSSMGLMGVITAQLALVTGIPPVLVFILTLVIGSMLGAINGLLITRARINPFIVTLGMLSVFRGVTLLITEGIPIRMTGPLLWLGKGYVGPVPVPAIIMLVVAVLGHIYATWTSTGRNSFAIGNNEKAAKFSGIRVKKVITISYMIMGALCGLAGLVTTATLGNAEPGAGAGRELDVIAAAVIGGVSLSGGEGSILGVILGAALMGVLKNGFVLLSIPGYWQTVAIGLVIIGAVAIDSFRTARDN